MLALQDTNYEPPVVHHIVITVEKSFSSIESGTIAPLEVTLEAMSNTSPSDCPTYRFKEWTKHEKSGLEFTLAATIPQLPPSMMFGQVQPEDDKLGMMRCLTSHQLWERYGIVSPPGHIYRPTNGWWLLVTSLVETAPVAPGTLLMCLESLRTLVDPGETLCFHLADIFRGKFLCQHWLQLIAIVFCRQAKIRVLDRHTYTFGTPVAVLEALSVIHNWSTANMVNRPMRRTVWQDRQAVFEHVTPPTVPDERPGKWLITQPKTRPSLLQWISHDKTDILQAPGIVVLCCPADLDSHAAMTRYVVREYGQKAIFQRRLAIGKALLLPRSQTAPWDNDFVLLFTRAFSKHLLLYDILHLWLVDLANKLPKGIVKSLHFPIYDPERSVNILQAWYSMLEERFSNANIKIVLRDRAFVSIA